jgi:hypothetical protein
VDGDLDGFLDIGRDAEVVRDLVGGTARYDAEGSGGTGEPGGNLGECAIAADDAYGAVAEAGGVPCQFRGVAGAGGRLEVEGCVPIWTFPRWPRKYSRSRRMNRCSGGWARARRRSSGNAMM